MQYQSTRDKNLKASSAQAILNGLAPDGGLYTMPSFDEVKFDYTTVLNMDTMSMSTKILSKLLPDFSEAEMAKLVHDGYTGKFETDHLTPTVPVGEDFILELFRGPTSAFKDVALSMLPRLMTASKEKLGVDDEIINILSQLRTKHRDLLQMRYWDSLSEAEAAEALRLSEEDFAARQTKAESRFRKRLSKRAPVLAQEPLGPIIAGAKPGKFHRDVA